MRLARRADRPAVMVIDDVLRRGGRVEIIGPRASFTRLARRADRPVVHDWWRAQAGSRARLRAWPRLARRGEGRERPLDLLPIGYQRRGAGLCALRASLVNEALGAMRSTRTPSRRVPAGAARGPRCAGGAPRG